MKILIDTNVLISAALSSSGTPYKAYLKAVTPPNTAIICTQNVDELISIFNRKFPSKGDALNKFLSSVISVLELVPVPEAEEFSECLIRDINDRPILRAAISSHADVILTGDKDFLESGLDIPRIVTPSEFLRM